MNRILTCIILIMLMSLALAVETEHIIKTQQLRRPHQFLMDVYTRPKRRGLVQRVRLDKGGVNSGAYPCWNLASKHVGSVDVNDPYVKVTFYRSLDCRGLAVGSIHGSKDTPSSRRYSSILKARSVSITKIRPILLNDSERFHKNDVA